MGLGHNIRHRVKSPPNQAPAAIDRPAGGVGRRWPASSASPDVGGQAGDVGYLEAGERAARGGVLKIFGVQAHDRLAENSGCYGLNLFFPQSSDFLKKFVW